MIHCVAASPKQDLDPEVVRERARAMLDERAAAVVPLATARQVRLNKRAELDEAERAESVAHAAALHAGWTAEELKELGFDTPERRPRGRPRLARSSAPRSRAAAQRQRAPARGATEQGAGGTE